MNDSFITSFPFLIPLFLILDLLDDVDLQYNVKKKC